MTMKNGVSGKGGVTLQINQMPSRRRVRPVGMIRHAGIRP